MRDPSYQPSSPTEVPGDRLILDPDARRSAVVDLIRGARRRLSLSLFRCNDKGIVRELAAAVERGVDVEVLVTSRAKGGKKKLRKLWQRLEATGSTVYAYNDPVVKYHAKYMVVDDGPAVVASLNFTKKCFTRTCDAMLLTYDPQVIRGLRQLMATDRDGIQPPASLPARIILGPEQARRQFTALIENARSSICLIDAKLSDPDLMALLDARKAAGVDVHIHDADTIGTLHTHGKIMLVDNTIAVIGSLALTALSLDFRREVAIETTDAHCVAAISSLLASVGIDSGARCTAVVPVGGGTTC
jgi:phosphatidylserine/phosphatidylglycerophosphate/cardiolipin synthase-like enzyme